MRKSAWFGCAGLLACIPLTVGCVNGRRPVAPSSLFSRVDLEPSPHSSGSSTASSSSTTIADSRTAAPRAAERPGISSLSPRVGVEEPASAVRRVAYSGEDQLPPGPQSPEKLLSSGIESTRDVAASSAGQPASVPLTIDQAIHQTLMMDPNLRAGFEEIRAASGDQITASLRPNPELEISQTLLPLTRPFDEEREGGPPQLDVMVSYPIDWWLFGKRAAAMQNSLRGLYVSQSEYANLVRERVLETALAYYDVVEAQALRDLAHQDVENLQQVEQITRIAVENGARPLVELSRIRLDRLASQQALRDAERNVVAARAALWATMGYGSVQNPFAVVIDLAAPIDGPQMDVATAVMIAQESRPDIQALRWKVDEARTNFEVEQREAYPEIVSQFGYTRQFQRKAIGFPDANSWGVGVAIELPLSNRNQGNRVRAQAEWSQSSHELQARMLELQAEIVSLFAELETARTNASATAEEQLRLAEEVRDSIRQAYDAGGRPLIDVLDSQRNFRETYGNYITSRADYWRAYYRFEAALAQHTPAQ